MDSLREEIVFRQRSKFTKTFSNAFFSIGYYNTAFFFSLKEGFLSMSKALPHLLGKKLYYFRGVLTEQTVCRQKANMRWKEIATASCTVVLLLGLKCLAC